MLTPVSFNNVGKLSGKLAEIYDKLGETDRQSLLAFAEFLLHRNDGEAVSDAKIPQQPADRPRPETESVVGAIKRLTDSYSMLERQHLFSQTSSLMSAHVLQGRPAAEIIDELEEVFRQHYQNYLETFKQD
jgi:hypothetical protein